MLKVLKRILLTLCALTGLITTVSAQETTTGNYPGPVLIPDNPSNIQIIVPVFINVALNITKVTVNVDIDHPRIGDLRIMLVNPTGRTRMLADKNCGGTRNLTNFTFDTAFTRFGDFCPTQPGQSAAPREQIDTWDGDTSIGIWNLVIEDDEDGNIGFLNSYTLRITGTRATAPTFSMNSIFDTASFRRGPLSPGELVWIAGTALGPATTTNAQLDQNGRLPTTLGGTTVTFDGTAVPINVASLNVLQVQVPNELAGRSSTTIVVQSQGASSGAVTASVVAASPGLYTLGGAGGGQLNAVNPNGTRNNPQNPVDRGTYIVVFANGLGTTNPAVPTGMRAPSSPLSVASLPITASIGGQPAQVLFAGLSPGFVGLFQLNISVPQNASTGDQVPLTITINGVPSQDDVFISVR